MMKSTTQLMRMTKPEIIRHYLIQQKTLNEVVKDNQKQALEIKNLDLANNRWFEICKNWRKRLNESYDRRDELERLVGYLALTTALGFAAGALAILISVW